MRWHVLISHAEDSHFSCALTGTYRRGILGYALLTEATNSSRKGVS